MVVTFKKTRASSRSYGRGSDNSYTPATYGVFLDGAQVGILRSPSRGFMEVANWHVCDITGRSIRLAGSFANAKAWATANVKSLDKPSL